MTMAARWERARRRFVRQDDAGPIGERAGNRHPLGLAARQNGRERVPAVADFQIVQKLDRSPSRFRGIRPGQVERDGDVVGAVEERQEIVELKDEADLVQEQSAQIRPSSACQRQPRRAW